MNFRIRLIAQCLLMATAAAFSALLLLTLLHSGLEHPALHAFDLNSQARVHAWTNPRLTRLMSTLTFIGSVKAFLPTLIAAVAILLAFGEKQHGIRLVRKREIAGLFAVGIGGASILNESLKLHFHRARPQVPWSIGDEHTFSFPSGHSLFSLVLYGLIAYIVLSRSGHFIRHLLVALAAASMAFGIGLSRIYLGMHWPTDVLAGYLTGGIWLTAVILIDHHWHRPSRKISISG